MCYRLSLLSSWLSMESLLLPEYRYSTSKILSESLPSWHSWDQLCWPVFLTEQTDKKIYKLLAFFLKIIPRTKMIKREAGKNSELLYCEDVLWTGNGQNVTDYLESQDSLQEAMKIVISKIHPGKKTTEELSMDFVMWWSRFCPKDSYLHYILGLSLCRY